MQQEAKMVIIDTSENTIIENGELKSERRRSSIMKKVAALDVDGTAKKGKKEKRKSSKKVKVKAEDIADGDDKARFLAHAKAELEEKRSENKAKERKEQKERRRSSNSKKEAQRRASVAEKRKSIATEASMIPAFLIEMETDPIFSNDYEICSAVQDVKRLRQKVAKLEIKMIDAEDTELTHINMLEDKLEEGKETYRKHLTKGLKRYSAKEAQDIEERGQERKKNTENLRKENQKFRDEIKHLMVEMKKYTMENHQLEHDVKGMKAAIEKLEKFKENQMEKGARAEEMSNKFIQAIDDQSEFLIEQTLMGEVECNVRKVYEKLARELLEKVKTCDDSSIAGKLQGL